MNFWSKSNEEDVLQRKIEEEESAIKSLNEELQKVRDDTLAQKERFTTLPRPEDLDVSLAHARLQARTASDDLARLRARRDEARARHDQLTGAERAEEGRLDRLCLLVEAQRGRVEELRRRAAQALFGLKGGGGSTNVKGSGGFLMRDDQSFRRRAVDEVGVLDSRWAVGTFELDGRWAKAQAGAVEERSHQVETELGDLGAEKVRLEKSVGMRGQYEHWAQGLEALGVLEEAHHRLAMDLVAMELGTKIIGPEDEFAYGAEDLYRFYEDRLAQLQWDINAVHDDHLAWRAVSYS
ncbi:hypothetical protein HK101_007195 [Irineochytrium annulatum]|nr:hypothetical protein HK101_007195 [Irineochytrium annulatum]